MPYIEKRGDNYRIVCRDLPDLVVSVANKRFLCAEPSAQDEWRYGGSLNIEPLFGIRESANSDFFPPSAYRGPFLPLLRNHPHTGRSEYHAWLVNPAGEKMDCSEFPTERYKRRFVWEPSEPIPEVDYTELPADTASVVSMAREIGYPI